MQTKLIDDIHEAAEILRAGGLVAFPTETVFGLGADACNPTAIERLFQAKGRPGDNPLIVHLADYDQWPLATQTMTPVAKKILDVFSPGPVTVILPKAASICAAVTAGLETVGIRIPSPESTRALLRACGIPVAAPSANLSGRPSGTTWQSVLEDLDGRVDAVLKVEVAHAGLESSVVDCTGEIPILLRPGAVGLSDLQIYFPEAHGLGDPTAATAGQLPSPGLARLSPGLRHPHYQPRAQVLLLDNVDQWVLPQPASSQRYAYAGIDAIPDGMLYSRRFSSPAQYAHGFYEFLREADRRGADVILLQIVPIETAEQSGIAAALRDRQRRAAGCA